MDELFRGSLGSIWPSPALRFEKRLPTNSRPGREKYAVRVNILARMHSILPVEQSMQSRCQASVTTKNDSEQG